jgi:hypothetical protein
MSITNSIAATLNVAPSTVTTTYWVVGAVVVAGVALVGGYMLFVASMWAGGGKGRAKRN